MACLRKNQLRQVAGFSALTKISETAILKLFKPQGVTECLSEFRGRFPSGFY